MFYSTILVKIRLNFDWSIQISVAQHLFSTNQPFNIFYFAHHSFNHFLVLLAHFFYFKFKKPFYFIFHFWHIHSFVLLSSTVFSFSNCEIVETYALYSLHFKFLAPFIRVDSFVFLSIITECFQQSAFLLLFCFIYFYHIGDGMFHTPLGNTSYDRLNQIIKCVHAFFIY